MDPFTSPAVEKHPELKAPQRVFTGPTESVAKQSPKRRAKHVTIFKLPRRLTVGAEESGSPIWVFNGIVIHAEVLQNTVRHQRLLAAEIAIRPRSGFLINL